jgi:hypothetical protein
MTAKYVGTMQRGDEQGVIVGTLRDEWGWVIELRGTYDAQARQYVLTGELGAPPEGLRIPLLDGEVTP